MAHSKETTEAWTAILQHVDIARVDRAFDEELWRRVMAFARAAVAVAPAAGKGVVKGTNGETLRSGKVCPFGRNKGTPIEELDDKDLNYIIGAMAESVKDPSKARFKVENQALLDACDRERATR